MNGFEVLADPSRRRILELLSAGELDAGSIAAHFDVSQPAISRHLKVLRESDVVTVRRDAQRRVYSLRPDGLSDVGEWVSRYRSFWSGRLKALDHALEEGDDNDQ